MTTAFTAVRAALDTAEEELRVALRGIPTPPRDVEALLVELGEANAALDAYHEAQPPEDRRASWQEKSQAFHEEWAQLCKREHAAIEQLARYAAALRLKRLTIASCPHPRASWYAHPHDLQVYCHACGGEVPPAVVSAQTPDLESALRASVELTRKLFELDDGGGQRITLEQFRADNEECLSDEELAAIGALDVGGEYRGGGGAAAEWTIRRVQ